MTQEEKQLLLKDLSARLPYGVKCTMWSGKAIAHSITETLRIGGLDAFMCNDSFSIKPYLRPMSSMTEKEKREFDEFICIDEDAWLEKENGHANQAIIMSDGIDWLNAHHFDYRGLIPMGLALEALDDMYKTE